MKLTGRVLYLTDNAEALRQQLDGQTIDARQDPKHFAVNTDAMISGQACTLGYTPEILGPHFLKNFKETVGEDEVRQGGFQVIVGGDAYGSGSSREVAVVAHQGAGIELVIADGFQRDQENMVCSGLPFTTDYAVLERLLSGEDVDLAALAEEPDFFRSVAAKGGLLPFGTDLMNGSFAPTYTLEKPARPLNAVEKVIAQQVLRAATARRRGERRAGRSGPLPGWVSRHARVHGGMVINLYKEACGDAPIENPELVACFEDHFVLINEPTVPESVKSKRLLPAQRLAQEMVEACQEYGVTLHGPGRDAPAGVCPKVGARGLCAPRYGALPYRFTQPDRWRSERLCVRRRLDRDGFRSAHGQIPVTVPKVVRVLIEGDAGGLVSPKDVILHLIGDRRPREEHLGEGPTDTCVVQFGGTGLDQWTVDELSVLTNMTVEGGLMTGLVEPCDPIRRFLAERDESLDVEPMLVYPDADAQYVRTMVLQLEEVPLYGRLAG